MTKNQIKFVRSLQQKKNRQTNNLFVVEGAKNVFEVLKSNWEIDSLFVSPEFEQELNNFLSREYIETPPILSKKASLQQAGTFKTNNTVLAVVKIPKQNFENKQENNSELILALDSIKDPGNLGTILRTADWYGIKQVICSSDCVDIYNPKVIASSMGSFLRIKVVYTDLAEFFKQNPLPVYGAFLTGKNIHEVEFEDKAILLIGSESHGIGAILADHVNKKIHIPRFGKAESLNAAIATAIICDNWKRKSKYK